MSTGQARAAEDEAREIEKSVASSFKSKLQFIPDRVICNATFGIRQHFNFLRDNVLCKREMFLKFEELDHELKRLGL